MMNAMGIPPEKARASDYGFPEPRRGLDPFPSITLGSATVSPINMANAYATIANGGRFHDAVHHREGRDQDGEALYDHSVSDKQAIDEDQGSDIAADVSYALQQVVQSGTGTAALASAARPPARPAPRPTPTTRSTRPGSPATRRSCRPSVMYVRGKGNEQLDGWLPSYFGGDYPADTWTAVMKRDMEGVESRSSRRRRTSTARRPTRATSRPCRRSRPRSRRPTETPSNTDKPTKTPTTGPTRTRRPRRRRPSADPDRRRRRDADADAATSGARHTTPSAAATATRAAATRGRGPRRARVAWWDRMRW